LKLFFIEGLTKESKIRQKANVSEIDSYHALGNFQVGISDQRAS